MEWMECHEQLELCQQGQAVRSVSGKMRWGAHGRTALGWLPSTSLMAHTHRRC